MEGHSPSLKRTTRAGQHAARCRKPGGRNHATAVSLYVARQRRPAKPLRESLRGLSLAATSPQANRKTNRGWVHAAGSRKI